MTEESKTTVGTPKSPSHDMAGEVGSAHRHPEGTAPAANPSHEGAAAPSVLETEAADLNKVKDAIVDSANMCRNIWLLFLSFGTYLAIAVGSTNHRHLFLQKPIRLPLFNVELPLEGFYFVAPILFLIFHFYLLVHLKLLSDKVHYYNHLLGGLVRGFTLDKITESHVRLQLPDFMFVQYLAGPSAGWKSLTHLLLVGIAWITIVFGPIILFISIQLKFLPYQNDTITYLHRIIIAASVCLSWVFWPKMSQASGTRLWLIYARRTTAFFLSLTVIIFSIFVAVFPGERLYRTRAPALTWLIPEEVFAGLTEYLFERPDENDRLLNWFSNRLVLRGETFVDVDTIEKINARRERQGNQVGVVREFTRILRGRHLIGAVLDNAGLQHADFSGAILTDARFFGAELQGAKFSEAHLQKASFQTAKLQRAEFNDAKLHNAYLDSVELQGASLYGATLQGASLNKANLQGANLDFATLQGASLNKTKLQGASLKSANLRGASLKRAEFQGASLNRSNLRGALLNSANFQGASLDHADLQGALLESAHLEHASFSNAKLQLVMLKDARLNGVSLSGANLWRAYGQPKLKKPIPILDSPPLLQAPTNEELAELKEDLPKLIDQLNKEINKLEKEQQTSRTVADNLKEELSDLKQGLAHFVEIRKKISDLRKDSQSDDTTNELLQKINGMNDREKKIVKETREEIYEVRLYNYIYELACDSQGSPFVAQALIEYRDLETAIPYYYPTLAKSLLAPLDNSICPGVKGLSAASLEKLRTWASIDKTQ